MAAGPAPWLVLCDIEAGPGLSELCCPLWEVDGRGVPHEQRLVGIGTWERMGCRVCCPGLGQH